MNRKDLITELEKRYGRGSFYSKFVSDKPTGEMLYHNKTGFSIGFIKTETSEAFLMDSGDIQQSYRIDRS